MARDEGVILTLTSNGESTIRQLVLWVSRCFASDLVSVLCLCWRLYHSIMPSRKLNLLSAGHEHAHRRAV
eukprot:6456484-Amphidinium_carterae.1